MVVTEYKTAAIQVRPMLLSYTALSPIAMCSLALSAMVNWAGMKY